ncbi:MAG: VanZ family protein [Candidatus Nitrotoga sp.]
MNWWSNYREAISVKQGNRSALWIWVFGSVALVVLALALMPIAVHMPTTGWDKANHLLAFAVLAWLGCHAYPQRMASVLLGLLAYGALIEILQSFTSYRFADWHDLLADGLGLLLGWLLTRMQRRIKRAGRIR